jgi:hypothetical protein
VSFLIQLRSLTIALKCHDNRQGSLLPKEGGGVNRNGNGRGDRRNKACALIETSEIASSMRQPAQRADIGRGGEASVGALKNFIFRTIASS